LPGTIQYNEEELVRLLKSNDKTAFEYLYDHYSGALFGIIIKMLDDQALAEDVLQEAFVKIWNNFSNYDPARGRLFTWMLNITRNLTIDMIRSKGYKKQAKIRNPENAVGYASDPASTNNRFDALGIRKQLDLLRDGQKQIIEMAYFEGLTQNEIAVQLGIPLGTIKTRMRAAILELKKILQV
jgi:RNA polymerase sigma-70 factor (ECF subfamily)